jgi:hypothetical protein
LNREPCDPTSLWRGQAFERGLPQLDRNPPQILVVELKKIKRTKRMILLPMNLATALAHA